MKKTIVWICLSLIMFALSVVEKANANSCFLATEDGSSANCDSGTAQAGLPVHGAYNYSKKGTRSLCNNVNVFADQAQALQYAKSHEYDSVQASAGCYRPKCTYETEAACAPQNSGKTCCKSLVNGKCWHECDLCRFNSIHNSYYPYADTLLEECELVGAGTMPSASFALSDSNSAKNYGISELRNLENRDLSTDEAWYCNLNNVVEGMENVKKIIDKCITKAQSTKMVKGYKTTGVVSKADYLCIKGRKFSLPNTSNIQNIKNFVKVYGCPLSAVQCDATSTDNYKKYFNSAEACETNMLNTEHNNSPCAVVVTYRDYADQECWHGAKKCYEYGHDDYRVGNYNSLTCPTGSNTHVEEYKNKDGHTVRLDGKKCGICECDSGFYRLSLCNQMTYEVVRDYYDSKHKCSDRGYKLERILEISGCTPPTSCSACPYSAKFWRCDEAQGSCEACGYTVREEDKIIGKSYTACPYSDTRWKLNN